MRTRKEIEEEACTGIFSNAAMNSELILEVALDCRDLLQQGNKNK